MVLKFLMSPKVAIYLITLFIGRPDIADDLISICNRESRCTEIKHHKIDAHLSNKEWHGQVRWNHIDPDCQPRKASGGWATHGPWGLSAGAHWNWVPACYSPEAFDNTYVSGFVAARKYIKNCWWKNNIKGWCRVPKRNRKNNLKRPRNKKMRKLKRPQNWISFFLQRPQTFY